MTPYSVGMEGPAAPPQETVTGIRIRLGERIGSFLRSVVGYAMLTLALLLALSFASWSVADPSLTHAAGGLTRNLMGPLGAIASDLLMQTLGLAGLLTLLPLAFFGLQLTGGKPVGNVRLKLLVVPLSILCLAAALSALPTATSWPLRHGFGGIVGDLVLTSLQNLLAPINATRAKAAAGLFFFACGMALLVRGLGMTKSDVRLLLTPSPRAPGAATAPWTKKLTAVAAATPIFGPKLFGAPQPAPEPQLPGLDSKPQVQSYGQPYHPAYPQTPMSPAASGMAYQQHAQHAQYPQYPMPAPAQRAQVYPHPFLRAHPMTANRPLAAVQPMQPQLHPINQTFVQTHPVVVVPMTAAMLQAHHVQFMPPQPAPRHAAAEIIDVQKVSTDLGDEPADDDSRAMAERFAPRASAQHYSAQNNPVPPAPGIIAEQTASTATMDPPSLATPTAQAAPAELNPATATATAASTPSPRVAELVAARQRQSRAAAPWLSHTVNHAVESAASRSPHLRSQRTNPARPD